MPTRVAAQFSPTVRGYLLSYVVLGFGLSIIGPALPFVQEHLDVSEGTIAVLFPLSSFGGLVGAIAAGRLYDGGGGHRVLAAGLVGMGAGVALFSWPSQLLVAGVLVMCLGFAGSLTDVGGNTLIMWSDGENLDRDMNLLHFMFGIGALLTPVAVTVAATSFDDAPWRGIWVVGAIYLIATVLLASFIRRLDPAPVARTLEVSAGGRPLATRLQLGLVACYFFIYVGVEVSMASWFYSYALNTHWDEAGASLVATGFWVGFTACRFTVAMIGHRQSPQRILFGSVVLSLIGSGLMFTGSSSPLLTASGVAALGAGVAPQFPTMLLFADRRIHTTASSTGVFLASAVVGASLWPWLLGQAIDDHGYGVLPPLAFAGSIVIFAMVQIVKWGLPEPVSR